MFKVKSLLTNTNTITRGRPPAIVTHPQTLEDCAALLKQQGAAVAVMQGTIRPARLRCVAGHGSIADLPGGGGGVGFGHWCSSCFGGGRWGKGGDLSDHFPHRKTVRKF